MVAPEPGFGGVTRRVVSVKVTVTFAAVARPETPAFATPVTPRASAATAIATRNAPSLVGCGIP